MRLGRLVGISPRCQLLLLLLLLPPQLLFLLLRHVLQHGEKEGQDQ
jgi:hypothetical protein